MSNKQFKYMKVFVILCEEYGPGSSASIWKVCTCEKRAQRLLTSVENDPKFSYYLEEVEVDENID